MKGPDELKKAALEIFRQGLKAVDPHAAMGRHLARCDGDLLVTLGAGSIGAAATQLPAMLTAAGERD